MIQLPCVYSEKIFILSHTRLLFIWKLILSIKPSSITLVILSFHIQLEAFENKEEADIEHGENKRIYSSTNLFHTNIYRIKLFIIFFCSKIEPV